MAKNKSNGGPVSSPEATPAPLSAKQVRAQTRAESERLKSEAASKMADAESKRAEAETKRAEAEATERTAKAARETAESNAKLAEKAEQGSIGHKAYEGGTLATAIGGGLYAGHKSADWIEKRNDKRVAELRKQTKTLAREARSAMKGTSAAKMATKTASAARLKGIASVAPKGKGPLGLGLAATFIADAALASYAGSQSDDKTVQDLSTTFARGNMIAAGSQIGIRAIQNQSSAKMVSLSDRAALKAAKIMAKQKPAAAAAAPAAPTNFKSMKVAELKSLAKARDVKIPARALKADIVKTLTTHESSLTKGSGIASKVLRSARGGKVALALAAGAAAAALFTGGGSAKAAGLEDTPNNGGGLSTGGKVAATAGAAGLVAGAAVAGAKAQQVAQTALAKAAAKIEAKAGSSLAKAIARKFAARAIAHAIPGVGTAMMVADAAQAADALMKAGGSAKGMGRGGVQTRMAPTTAGDVSRPRGTAPAKQPKANGGEVQGHFSHSKSGKVIWVRPFQRAA